MSAALGKAFSIVFALGGHSFEGLRLKQIAEGIDEQPSTTLRVLVHLAELGVVERIPGRDESWRLAPRVVQLALAHQHEVSALTQRVDDFSNRYSRIR